MSSTNPSGSSFAKILLGLDGSSYSQAATEFACQIALKHSAAITGVAVIDLPDIERAIGPAPVGGIHYAEQAEQRLLKQTQEKVQGILQNFERVCQSKNINYAVHADTGRPFEEIIEESKYHDFLVLGQKTFFRYNVADEPGNTLDSGNRWEFSLRDGMKREPAPRFGAERMMPANWFQAVSTSIPCAQKIFMPLRK